MASFFNDDDSDEESFAQPAVPGRWHGRQVQRPAPARASSSRQQSILSESSRAGQARNGNVEGSGPGSRSFMSRLESTMSPRSDRVSESIPLGDRETDDMSSMNGTASQFGYTAGQRPGNRKGGTRYDEEDGMDVDSQAATELGLGRMGGFRGIEGINGMDDDEDLLDADLDDVKRLGKAWVKERGTVDIMQWEGDLIDTLFDKLEQQQKMIETLRSDPQTSEEEHFKLMLVMTEMERVKYLVRSYARTRLWKIEKFSHHIVITPELHARLSGAELSHARRYTQLLHTHYQHSVLDSLPEWLRKMDDQTGEGLSMSQSTSLRIPFVPGTLST